jgi:hypothetical protein
LCEALDDGRVDHLGITDHRGSPGHKRWKQGPKGRRQQSGILARTKKSIEI